MAKQFHIHPLSLRSTCIALDLSKEKQLGVDHDPEDEDVDDEDVVHPMLLCILWQLVVPYQPASKQHEHKLLLLLLQEQQPRLAEAEAARELAGVAAAKGGEDLQ